MTRITGIIGAYAVLIFCIVAMYLILVSMGNVEINVRDTVLAVCGGIFGGIAFKYFDIGLLQK